MLVIRAILPPRSAGLGDALTVSIVLGPFLYRTWIGRGAYMVAVGFIGIGERLFESVSFVSVVAAHGGSRVGRV
jgi:hypothetical protein